MTFTDEDLLKLVNLLDANSGPIPSREFFYALINRLKAAEAICEAYGLEDRDSHTKCDDSCTTGYYQREVLKVYAAWKKAKGIR